MAEELITLRNKKTGEVIQVPRSQYVTDYNDREGLPGIGEDIMSSLMSALPALGEMVSSIPGGAKKAGSFAVKNITNPLNTLKQLGLGGAESLAGLASSPQILARYLAEKFPNQNKIPAFNEFMNLATPYEGLKNVEKQFGQEAQPNSEEETIRNIGGMIGGSAGLTKLPSIMGRVGTLAGEQAGRGGDPVHAALLALIGEKTGNVLGHGINKAANAPPQLPLGAPGTKPPSLTANMAQLLSNPGYMNTIGNIPQAALNMGKAIPKVAKKVPETAAQTAASILENAADYGSKIPGAASILQPTAGALGSYLKYLSVAPEEMAKRKLFGEIDPMDIPIIDQRLAAAKRLGIKFLTPGEALLSPFQAAEEANIGQTKAGSKLLYQKGKERSGSEATAIDNLLDTIYDKKTLSPEKEAAYKEAMQSTVPPEFIDKWKKDPIVEYALKQLKSEPEYKRASHNMPENSFEYWDIVKRIISDMEKGEAKGMKKFKSDQATKARNEMVDEMDIINPKYEYARNIAEREFTRKDLEKVFDKKSMTLNNFWSFLKSDSQFNKIMKKLEPFPDAQQKLQDIRMLSNEMIPFDETIRTSYKLQKTGMTKQRNKLDALKQAFDQKYGEKHDIATVELMTNPKWRDIFVDYLKEEGK